MIALRTLGLVMGWVMLALAAAGTVLPLLPTTPFLLAAAWCFCRTSPRMALWLMKNPLFGPALQTWRNERAIAPRTKLVAIVSMAAGYLLTISLSAPPPAVAAGLALLLLAVAAFILGRPTPAR